MSKEFTKSYAINRIAELNEQIVEMTAEQSETMRYLNKLRDNNKQLKQQLEEKDKEIEMLNAIKNNAIECADLFKVALSVRQKDLAIQELEKVNGILTDTIIEVTQNEFDLNKLCYLEEISAKFGEKIQEQIKELKG